MDPAFEITVTGQDGADREIAVSNGFGHRFGQRAGIADTGGTTVTDNVETQGFQIIH